MPAHIIGVMSGSSLDGLDMALCAFDQKGSKTTWQILAAQSVPYTANWKKRLAQATSLNGFELMELDADLGFYIGDQVKQWQTGLDITPDLIASHGHTVFHEPAKGFTTQIGNGACIVARAGMDAITNFRNSDVALGGQGAPFAPIADRDLFSGYDGYLNLGGIANISLHDQGKWTAWDVCPCNQAMDFLANRLNQDYDRDGNLAATGIVDQNLVMELINYYPVPEKSFSLSNDQVHQSWIAVLRKSDNAINNLLASVVESIVTLLIRHVSASNQQETKILVTGGGAHNSFLLNRLQQEGMRYHLHFEKPVDQIIDFKESLLMAYLGFLNMRSLPFQINTITGAIRDSIGGAYYKAIR